MYLYEWDVKTLSLMSVFL